MLAFTSRRIASQSCGLVCVLLNLIGSHAAIFMLIPCHFSLDCILSLKSCFYAIHSVNIVLDLGEKKNLSNQLDAKPSAVGVPLREASLLLIIVSALAGCFSFSFFFLVCVYVCVYLLLPWDLHSKQGLLFNGTIIKCAFSKHWCFALSLFTHPYTSHPRHPTHTSSFPHSAAFLEVNASKSLAAKHQRKCSRENSSVQACNVQEFVFPTKHPILVVKGKGAAGGHISRMVCIQISE